MPISAQPTDRQAGRSSTAPRTPILQITRKLQNILVGEVVVTLGSVAAALALAGATYGMATEDHFHGTTLFFGYLADAVPAAFFAMCAVLSAVVSARIWKMLRSAGSRDLANLKQLSSAGWAVVAIFASFIAPGIALLRVHRAVEDLASGSE